MPASKPSVPKVSDVEAVFGSIAHLPDFDSLPEDFRKQWHRSSHPWCGIASKLFYEGGSLKELGLTPKEGIDLGDAMRVIRSQLRSWEPKHEHKIAGVGFLLSQWFDRAA